MVRTDIRRQRPPEPRRHAHVRVGILSALFMAPPSQPAFPSPALLLAVLAKSLGNA